MPRIAFELRVRPELLDEYLARHTAVWPEMLAEIAAAGRRNYSLFLAERGRLVGCYETDDDAAAQAYLAASPVATRWEADMARFFVGADGGAFDGRADQTSTPLREVFNLENQLAAHRATAADTSSGTPDSVGTPDDAHQAATTADTPLAGPPSPTTPAADDDTASTTTESRQQ